MILFSWCNVVMRWKGGEDRESHHSGWNLADSRRLLVLSLRQTLDQTKCEPTLNEVIASILLDYSKQDDPFTHAWWIQSTPTLWVKESDKRARLSQQANFGNSSDSLLLRSFSFAAIEACKNSVKNQVPSLHNVLLTIAAVGSSACMPPSEQSYVTTQQVRKDDDDLQLNRARDSTVVAYGVRATTLEATLHLSLSLTVQYQSQGVSTFNHSNAGSYCSKVSSRK